MSRGSGRRPASPTGSSPRPKWENATRAGTTTPYATGATITTVQADFDDSASGQDLSYPQSSRLTVVGFRVARTLE